VAGPGAGSGELAAGLGVPLAEVYLEFLAGRCRPNTVLAAASDLRVFFAVVARPPDQVRLADVLAFVTAQRVGRADGHGMLQPVDLGGEPAGVSAATVRRRLSIVSGFFAFLQACGDVVANPVPRGLPTRRERPKHAAARTVRPLLQVVHAGRRLTPAPAQRCAGDRMMRRTSRPGRKIAPWPPRRSRPTVEAGGGQDEASRDTGDDSSQRVAARTVARPQSTAAHL
jgi:hypothetical protein